MKQAKVRDYEKHPIPSPMVSYGARIDQLVYKLYGLPPSLKLRRAQASWRKLRLLKTREINDKEKVSHREPMEVLESIAGAEKEIVKILEEIKSSGRR